MEAEARCLNCDATLTGRYCAACGQEHLPEGPNLRDAAAEAWDEFVKIDGKVLATLKSMIRHPGQLTRDYFEGKRARYVTPFKLYLSCSAIYFLVMNMPSVHKAVQGQQYVKVMRSDGTTPDAVVHDALQLFFAHLDTTLILLAPVTGFVLWFLFRGLKRPFFFHLVCALHIWSAMFLMASICYLTRLTFNFFGAFFFPCLVYGAFTFRRATGRSWPEVMAKSLLFSFGTVFICVWILLGFVMYEFYIHGVIGR